MNLSPLAIQKFFDNNGRPLNGGLLFTYEAGTSTKIATYTSDTGLSQNTNPIVLDFRGEARVWIDPELTYKFVLAREGDTDPPSNPIWTVDNIQAGITFEDLTREIIGEILWPRTAAEIAAGVTPTYYYYEPGDVRRYGAVGDSNGTSGSGSDNTVAIQSAVDQAKNGGDAVYAPIGIFRHTAPIDFTGIAATYEFGGESMLDTVFFADYTSGSRVANFNLGNPTGTRARVYFNNFKITGRGAASARIVGLYLEYTSELTYVENVYISQFDDGLIVANDYYTKFVNLQCVLNLANGAKFGYELDGSTLAPSFNNTILGGDFTLNGAWGLFVFGAQAFSAHGIAMQGNKAGQGIFNLCEGGGLFGTYIEHDPNDVATPTAQVYVINCNGFGIYSIPCPAFRHDGTPIILVETSEGVTLANFRPRTTGGPFNSVAIQNVGSTLTVNDSKINDCATGLSMQSAGKTSLNNVSFGNCTTSVLGNGSANVLDWNLASSADVATANLNAANIVDIAYNDNTKNQIQNTEVFNISCSVAELNAGGKIIIDSILPSERWRIVDIIIYNDTAFDAGGDRNVRILDAVSPVIYTTVTEANLKAAPAVNRWGSTVVPFPVNADMYTPTTTQHALRVEYSGGTTNFATGNLNITVTAMRTQ